jgi:hypothetical protein
MPGVLFGADFRSAAIARGFFSRDKAKMVGYDTVRGTIF